MVTSMKYFLGGDKSVEMSMPDILWPQGSGAWLLVGAMSTHFSVACDLHPEAPVLMYTDPAHVYGHVSGPLCFQFEIFADD